ncbi:hypothetical protein ElyMa_003772000 [Elysia marginata]|uniref:ZP domain-containing protein n=1 Tax=Elysia marginata TaxID=1093978 RepID=A0AAV4FAV4_9GAST|nr:hypothetical protein ElyMa_003772000 [Elysia marginata]
MADYRIFSMTTMSMKPSQPVQIYVSCLVKQAGLTPRSCRPGREALGTCRVDFLPPHDIAPGLAFIIPTLSPSLTLPHPHQGPSPPTTDLYAIKVCV